MNRYLLYVIAIFVTIGLSSKICCCDDFNFRKTTWGMSVQQVLKSEPLETAHSEKNVLGYKVKVLDKDVYLGYIFIDNKLVRARYILAEEHSNKNDFINDYDTFKKILIKKYGKPIKDDVIWRNRLFKKNSSDWGMAISIGHLAYFSKWDTEHTEILCFLYGDNHKIKCGVEYVSKKLKQLEKNYKEKKGLENF